MKVSFDLELKDVPGQLLKALEPISSSGGNIISIVHIREELSKRGRVPVKVICELKDTDVLEDALKELEKRDIWVSVDEVKRKKKMTVILIGHVVDTDLRDTIDRINEIRGVMVADLALSMPHPDKESSARMDIEVSGPIIGTVLKRLDEIAGEKGLVIIKSLEVSN